MIDPYDDVFAARLERAIILKLNGDLDSIGLYRSLAASQDWEQFLHARGVIKGYEAVLAEMQDILRSMNDERAQRLHPMQRAN